MILKITNFEDAHTSCPTQFSFDVVDDNTYNSGYIRYRHGHLRLTLYPKSNVDVINNQYSVGMQIGEEWDGDITFKYAQKVLKRHFNIQLDWDGVCQTYEG